MKQSYLSEDGICICQLLFLDPKGYKNELNINSS